MIRRITLRNFKAFKDQPFALGSLTLLSGLNGSGKSSLVQALLMLRQSYDAGVFKLNTLILNGPFAHLGTDQDLLNESAADETISISIESDDQEPFRCELWFPHPNARSANVNLSGKLSLLDSLFSPRFTFLSADRIVPQIHYGVPDQRISGKLGIHGEWTVDYLNRFGNEPISLNAAAHPLAKSLQLVYQVEAWMGEISPGVQLHLEPNPGLDLIGLSYSFVARRDISKRFRPTNVGFGVTYALPVVVAALSAEPGDLLVIDSPEAHLHPRGQAKLAELFAQVAASGVQLIIESHSDHVMNGVRLAVHDGVISPREVSLLYFRWDSQKTPLSTRVMEVIIDRDGRIDEWPEGFFDEFDKSLESLLTPRK